VIEYIFLIFQFSNLQFCNFSNLNLKSKQSFILFIHQAIINSRLQWPNLQQKYPNIWFSNQFVLEHLYKEVHALSFPMNFWNVKQNQLKIVFDFTKSICQILNYQRKQHIHVSMLVIEFTHARNFMLIFIFFFSHF